MRALIYGGCLAATIGLSGCEPDVGGDLANGKLATVKAILAYNVAHPGSIARFIRKTGGPSEVEFQRCVAAGDWGRWPMVPQSVRDDMSIEGVCAGSSDPE